MLSMPTKRRRAKDYAVSWLQVLLPDYYECKQRFSSVIGASSSVVIGWDKNSTVIRCKCTWRTTTYYNAISWHCEHSKLLQFFQQSWTVFRDGIRPLEIKTVIQCRLGVARRKFHRFLIIRHLTVI